MEMSISSMANIDFTGLEICPSLIRAYATLSLDHRKLMNSQESEAKIFQTPVNQSINYKNAFALLILNASIIEGTLRSILSEKVGLELIQETENRIFLGRNNQSPAEALLLKFLYEIETNGGWENLKKHYSSCFNHSLASIINKDLTESIEVLFRLRNVLSHGTAIIQPNTKMDDSMKELYPYKWQTDLQSVSVYLNKIFKKDDIFANLSQYSMPEHFWEKTKELFIVIEQKFNPLPSRSSKIITMIKSYEFGYKFPLHY